MGLAFAIVDRRGSAALARTAGGRACAVAVAEVVAVAVAVAGTVAGALGARAAGMTEALMTAVYVDLACTHVGPVDVQHVAASGCKSELVAGEEVRDGDPVERLEEPDNSLQEVSSCMHSHWGHLALE